MKILSIAVVASCLAGCYSTGDGPDPSTALYFPVGLAVSPGGRALYVANSDFDLQFNAGTVQAYNLDNIRAFFSPIWSADSSLASSDLCNALGLGANPTQILYPGICGALNLDSPPAAYFAMPNPNGTADPIAKPIASSTRIGAFATDVLYACHPSDDITMGGTSCTGSAPDMRGGRLFVPVRGDPSLTFIDVDDDRGDQKQNFRLDCGQGGNAGRCADSHRIGIDPGENTRGLKLPAEPFGIAISDRADAIAISHQIPGGAVSLITGTGGTVMDVKPRLEFVTGGLPAGTTGITALPIPALVTALGSPTLMNYQEGFVVTYRGAAQADVLRFFDDRFAAPARPFLTRVGAFGFSATPSGIDSRSVAIDRTALSSQRVACEMAAIASAKKSPKNPDDCKDEVDCLRKANCARIPLSVFVANRVPPSLLIGDVTTPNPVGSTDNLQFFDSVPLAQGPSRVVIGKIKNAAGVGETRIFAICFDARLIYVYDPVRRRIDGQIRTGRGPHALVMDPIEAIAYIGHFTDSYIGLIDLDQSHAGTYASVVATIGAPQPPKDSK